MLAGIDRGRPAQLRVGEEHAVALHDGPPRRTGREHQRHLGHPRAERCALLESDLIARALPRLLLVWQAHKEVQILSITQERGGYAPPLGFALGQREERARAGIEPIALADGRAALVVLTGLHL